MTHPSAASMQLARPLTDAQVAAQDIRSGREIVALAEELYLRLFVIALGGLQFVCGLAIVVSLVRTSDASFTRTTALALSLAAVAAIVLRAPLPCYRAIRLMPILSLTAPLLALCALGVDRVSHSPLSYAAAVSIAFPAFVCGRRWALAAATLISAGAVSVALVDSGTSALNSVGQGTAGYFVWALVLAGLAERFAQLTMRMPHGITSPPRPEPPVQVPNLAAKPVPAKAGQPDPTAPVSPPDELAGDVGMLTARQLQVVALLADGMRAEEIADLLAIKTATVYRHVQIAKERAGAATRIDLVALALRSGLVPARVASSPGT